jgi:hypothetical protein
MTMPIQIPMSIVNIALDDLEYWGQRGVESIALFLGRWGKTTAHATTVVLADEPGVTRAVGLLRLSELWMLRLTQYCDEQNLSIVAQIHSHPHDAWHSFTDDHHLVHGPDLLSLVVPNFAQSADDRDHTNWAVFVGRAGGQFDDADANSVLRITHDGKRSVVIVTEDGWRNAAP